MPERKPLTLDAIRQAAQRDSSAATQETAALSAKPPMNETMVQLNVRVPRSLRDELAIAVNAVNGLLLERGQGTILPRDLIVGALRPVLQEFAASDDPNQLLEILGLSTSQP